MQAEFTPEPQTTRMGVFMVEMQTRKQQMQAKMVKFCDTSQKGAADCERLSRDVDDHMYGAMRTAVENAHLKRKLAESQSEFTYLLKQQKAGCSILPGPTAPKLCVFKF
jgi:hypothetical protein